VRQSEPTVALDKAGGGGQNPVVEDRYTRTPEQTRMAVISVRFLQTSDWHLGQPYGNVRADLADRLRRGRVEAVGRILAEARRLKVDFVLAAGDQFDGPNPDPAHLDAMFQCIEAEPSVTIHMIPGNHDPDQAGSVYQRQAFRDGPRNLIFHRQPVPVPLPDHGVTLYPCPCLARWHGDDPTTWAPPRTEGDGLRIVLAHGNLPNAGGEQNRNYPIHDRAAERLDVDYVAVGDWHSPTPDPAARPGERLYYAGAPEPGGFDEPRAGFVLLVELEPGREPRVTAIKTGAHRWLKVERRLDGAGDLGPLIAELAREAGPRTLVRVKPTGSLVLAERDELIAAFEGMAAHFAHLEHDLSELTLREGDDLPLTADPRIKAVWRRLERLAANPSDGPPPDLPADPPIDAEAAVLALRKLRSLVP
jgi:DNA repair exonuclease SbcCD nuclease subunit